MAPKVGTHLSEEHKRKISLSLTGFKRPIGSLNGNKNPFYGKRHSEITRRLIGQLQIGKRVGENNPNYGKHASKETRQKQSLAHLGKKLNFTKEHIAKIAQSNKGRICSEELKKHLSEIQKGKKLSDETKNRMKIAHRGIHVGALNNQWRGGCNQAYPFEFNHILKESIRERDGYLCQLCHITQNGTRLHVHHIDYNKYNLNLSNLISLCQRCHAKTNSNREHYIQYLSYLLNQNIALEVMDD